MLILAIETSCDDTGVAILEADKEGDCNLLSNIVSSQVKIHAPYGGVVPNLAGRAHQENLVPVLELALREAAELRLRGESKIKNQELSERTKEIKEILRREPALVEKTLEFLNKYEKPNIDLISVTYGPGLAPCLWVGVNFAKALASAWNLSVVPVNHIEAHIAANWLKPIGGITNYQLPTINLQKNFSAICLVVSGGHTQLILIKGNPPARSVSYDIIGETRDDAVGEAFDKVAKLLNLGYPGGPNIAETATKIKNQKFCLSDKQACLSDRLAKIKNIKFPRPMINTDDFDFSFSGLKTSVLYFVKTLTPRQIKKLTPVICAEFQQAAVEVLVKKTMRAVEKYGVKTVMLAGGVSANDLLRSSLKNEAEKNGIDFLTPEKQFCSDNAGMVAMAGWWHRDQTQVWENITVEANLRLN